MNKGNVVSLKNELNSIYAFCFIAQIVDWIIAMVSGFEMVRGDILLIPAMIGYGVKCYEKYKESMSKNYLVYAILLLIGSVVMIGFEFIYFPLYVW